MKKRQVQINLVCEDRAHESFIRGYLSERGYSLRKLDVAPYPAKGRGSGKESVRIQYAKWVDKTRSYCRMNRSETCCLIALIDCDTDSQQSIYVDMDSRLDNPRNEAEHIAVFAPKRCIETWAYHLLDYNRTVDETTDYSEPRHNVTNDDCRRAGEQFAVYISLEACPLPSLSIGSSERQHISGP